MRGEMEAEKHLQQALGVRSISNVVKYLIETLGGALNHGDSPRTGIPNTGGNAKEFKTKNLCVLYIRFAGEKITTRQAYILMDDFINDDLKLANLSIPYLKALHNNTLSVGGKVKRIEDTLDNFSFKTQHVFLIYLDNDPKCVRFYNDATGEFIVRFSELSGEDPDRKILENYTFYGLRNIPISPNDPIQGNQAYILNYWNMDKNGNKLSSIPGQSDTYKRFAMNIILQMAIHRRVNTDSRWAPLILDPDTGNMGTEP